MSRRPITSKVSCPNYVDMERRYVPISKMQDEFVKQRVRRWRRRQSRIYMYRLIYQLWQFYPHAHVDPNYLEHDRSS